MTSNWTRLSRNCELVTFASAALQLGCTAEIFVHPPPWKSPWQAIMTDVPRNVAEGTERAWLSGLCIGNVCGMSLDSELAMWFHIVRECRTLENFLLLWSQG